MKEQEKNRCHELKADLLRYIREKFRLRNGKDISYDYPLLEKGIIDSLSMMTLIMYIEKKYKLDFYEIDVNRDDFADINTIARMIMKNSNE